MDKNNSLYSNEYVEEFLTYHGIKSESELNNWIRTKHKPINLSLFLTPIKKED